MRSMQVWWRLNAFLVGGVDPVRLDTFRRCLALMFSSGHALFQVELLARVAGGGRARVQDEEVLRFGSLSEAGGLAA